GYDFADLLPKPVADVFLADHLVQLDAVVVVAGTVRIADGDHLAAGLSQQLGGGVPDVANTLDRNRRVLGTDLQMPERRQGGQHAASTRGFGASFGAADAKRLAGHDRPHRVARLHADGVQHPVHDLWLGVDVGGGDVP